MNINGQLEQVLSEILSQLSSVRFKCYCCSSCGFRPPIYAITAPPPVSDRCMVERFHQLLAVGLWFPQGTPVSSTRKLISSSSFHRLDMTLAVAEALNPNTPIKHRCMVLAQGAPDGRLPHRPLEGTRGTAVLSLSTLATGPL